MHAVLNLRMKSSKMPSGVFGPNQTNVRRLTAEPSSLRLRTGYPMS